jgi:hypothetical protein
MGEVVRLVLARRLNATPVDGFWNARPTSLKVAVGGVAVDTGGAVYWYSNEWK